jgi:hypothetical protein
MESSRRRRRKVTVTKNAKRIKIAASGAKTKTVTRTRTVLIVAPTDAVAAVEVEIVRTENVAVVVIEPVDDLVALKNLAVAGPVALEIVVSDRAARKVVGIAIVIAAVDPQRPSRNRPQR